MELDTVIKEISKDDKVRHVEIRVVSQSKLGRVSETIHNFNFYTLNEDRKYSVSSKILTVY